MYNVKERNRIENQAKEFRISKSTYLNYESPINFIKEKIAQSSSLTDNYKLNVRYSLLASFSALREAEVQKICNKENYNYYRCYSRLDEILTKRYGYKISPGYHASRLKKKSFTVEREFILEAFLLFNFASIAELFSCKICLDENLSRKDMEGCSKGNNTHLFCIKCIKSYMNSQFINTKSTCRCMEPACSSHYSLNVIEKTMENDEIVLLKKYATEIEAFKKTVTIQDYYKCPSCEYGKVIKLTSAPRQFNTVKCNPQNTVLECLNERCKRKTCIFCKEGQHLPWSCIENRYWSPERANAYIKKKADEAIIRNCPKCGRVFHDMVVERRTDPMPCNRAECVCGFTMCYVCREELNSATNNLNQIAHFASNRDSKSCKLHNTRAEHKRMDKAKYAQVIKHETELYKNFLQEEKRKKKEFLKKAQRENEAKQLATKEKRRKQNKVLEVIDENSELKLKNDKSRSCGLSSLFRCIFRKKKIAEKTKKNSSWKGSLLIEKKPVENNDSKMEQILPCDETLVKNIEVNNSLEEDQVLPDFSSIKNI